MATPKLKARGKGIATKQPKYTGYELSGKPYVKILKCIGFQKFRYCGENRPGKKYQDKDFLQLALSNMSGKNVKIQIVCFDPDKPGEIHPNGLVGRDCLDGIYIKTYPISKPTQIIRIPYLRTERILTKKKDENKGSGIHDVLKARASHLPYPYNQRCLDQIKRDSLKYDTTRVCFGVIVTLEDSSLPEPLCVISNVVQNASEKTTLNILRMSTHLISAQEGCEVDIFTSEDGPPITAGKCTLKVKTDDWDSEETKPSIAEILYKRVVSFRIPPYKLNPFIESPVEATLLLSCIQSGQTCQYPFKYVHGLDTSRRSQLISNNRASRKRPNVSDDEDSQPLNDADIIKLNLKAKVQHRQAPDEPVYDLHKRIRTKSPASNGNIPVTVNQALTPQHSTIPQSKDRGLDAGDIIWAKDVITGEVVYLRADAPNPMDQPSENVVVYVQDHQQTLVGSGSLSNMALTSGSLSGPKAVAVPVSEWNAVSGTGAAMSYRNLEPVRAHSKPVARKTGKQILSAWIVDEQESTPLMNGDVTFSTATTPFNLIQPTTSFTTTTLKQEVVELSQPINSHGLPIFLDSGAEVTSVGLASIGNFFEANIGDLKFDSSGTLDSVSVFEMVTPYLKN